MKIQIKKTQSALSLTTTLAIAFFALSAVVLLISSGLQIFFNIQTQQEAISGKQQLIAQDAAGAVASFIQEKLSVLEAAVTLGDPTTASKEEQKRVLEKLVGLDPAFRHLVLLDSQEQELARISRLSWVASGRLTDRARGDFFAQVSQGKWYIGPIYIDEVTCEPMVVVAVPATDAFGDFQGALMAEVKLKFMWDLVDRLKIGEAGLAYVVDKQGNLIAFGDVARVLRGENVSHLKEVGEFISNPTPVDETAASTSAGINGTTIVGTYVPLGTPDWAVVTELPVREAYREIIRGAVISVGVVLVMAMLTGLSGVYVARRLAVPLLDLTETATQIAEGDLNLEATVEGPIEVVRLADAFNSMTTQLRSLIGSLEQRVADRTRGLQTAAEVARATTSVLDPDELMHQAVDLVRERFDLYYVGLFLLDEERRFAVLRTGTGEAGQQMIAKGHKLEVGGDSMIAQCVAGGRALIVLDGSEEAVRFDNPLLPDTTTEMALPLRSRGRIIGAMTVQSTKKVVFDEADLAVMQTMADQIAVAIENARLYDQAQKEIIERKRAEEELRQLKEFNESIVQGMEEGIVVEDAVGHIIFANPKMAEMLSYTVQDLVGKHWSGTIAPSCLSQMEEESNKRPEWTSSRYEAVLLRKDGREVPGLISARPLFGEGQFVGTLAVFTDLTEMKEMEQQLIQSEKLAAIGELVAGVAHELNNPLASVVGYSELLLGAECSEGIKRDLERINRQGLRAARIVENLLTFARRRKPQKESININDVIEKSLELQAPQLELDHIYIIKKLDETLPLTLADPFQMQQVFINIIGNAHQALRAWEGNRQLKVRSKLAGDMIRVEFSDSGPGIPPEVIGRLFEPFFTTREVGQGTGLGLSISYGIVEAHGGRIWAKSEVGKGATFLVEIPAKGH